jgi:hypothetical protein
MREALARHDQIVNLSIPSLGGHVIKTKGEGDSVFAVFASVADAVAAALALQSAFAFERWVTSAPIRVRMAIHTGRVQLREGDYYGPTVNRCARLRALARGGQVLLSDVAAQTTQRGLPDGANLRDLGTHQLKDLIAPERVWQLTHPVMESPATSSPRARPTAMPIRRAYKLTDQQNCSADGRQWGAGVKHKAQPGLGATDGRIFCYTSPTLAVLLNPLHERYPAPRIWEALVDVEPMRGDAIVACGEVATTRLIAPPKLTGAHHARFAVLCAVAAGGESASDSGFGEWAAAWLDNPDESLLPGQYGDDRGRMFANAVRAANAVGDDARAVEYATEAIRTAMSLSRLDLPALARQAVASPAQQLISCQASRV